MFPLNNRMKGQSSLMTSTPRSAFVPSFNRDNSDVGMDSNRSRDFNSTQYVPNADYKAPAIGPSENAMTPSGSTPGAFNPMGYGTPGMMGASMPMMSGIPDSSKGGVPYSGMGGVPNSASGGVPYSGQSMAPGLGPSFKDYKQHMESNLPRQKNDIQTNTNRISQGLGGFRDTSKNDLSFMGQPISFGGGQQLPINRKVQY